MADVGRTCANCGHTQESGDFCENCGTRMPTPPTGETVAQAGGVSVAGAAAGGATAAGAGGTPSGGGTPPPPPTYGAQSQYGAPPPRRTEQRRSFWSRLLDFSFEEFITPTIIKVLFIVAMVVIGLTVLGMIVAGFYTYGVAGIFWLVGALIWGFVALLFARVWLELVVIFFRIRDNTEEIAGGKR